MNDWIPYTDINGVHGWYNVKTHKFTDVNPQTNKRTATENSVGQTARVEKQRSRQVHTSRHILKEKQVLRRKDAMATRRKLYELSNNNYLPTYTPKETISQGYEMNPYVKAVQDLAYQNAYNRYLNLLLQQQGLAFMNEVLPYTFPSTYIGAWYNTGPAWSPEKGYYHKNFWDNVHSKQGFGDRGLNLVVDMATPFVINKLIPRASSKAMPTILSQASSEEAKTPIVYSTRLDLDYNIMIQRLNSPGYMDMLELNMIPTVGKRVKDRSSFMGIYDMSTQDGRDAFEEMLFSRGYTSDQVHHMMSGKYVTAIRNGENAYYFWDKPNDTSYVIASSKDPYMNSTISHEVAHSLGHPNAEGFRLAKEAFDFNSFPKRSNGTCYYTEHNATELSARGTQIKNYLGITDKTEITGDQLKEVAKNYVKETGQDNGMTEFFNAIKDWDKAAKFINNYAPAVIGVGAGIKILNNETK